MQKLVCPDQIKLMKAGLARPLLVTRISPTQPKLVWTWFAQYLGIPYSYTAMHRLYLAIGTRKAVRLYKYM